MVTEKPVLSIIVAVYNSSDRVLLEDCLNSIILQQTTIPYEIICIDDGSDDKSNVVLHKYLKEFQNIITISQYNHGAAYSKNIGMKYCNGEYVWIINSDDCIHNGSLDEILNVLKDNSPDLLKVRLRNINENKFQHECWDKYKNFNAKLANSFIEPPHDDVTSIMRSDIIKTNAITFHTDMKYHYDRLFGIQYYSYIDQKCVYFIDDIVYLRRQRTTSEMGKMSNRPEARRKYYIDSVYMAIEYHNMQFDKRIKDSRILEFIEKQKNFFIENAVVILPSTGLDKKTELARLSRAGVYPYRFNFENVKNAKDIKVKAYLSLRYMMTNRTLYSLYFLIQSKRKPYRK